MVKDPNEVKVIFTPIVVSEPNHRDEQGYRSSMTGKSPLPWHEYLPEALPTAEIIIWLVENAVSKAGTDNSSNQ